MFLHKNDIHIPLMILDTKELHQSFVKTVQSNVKSISNVLIYKISIVNQDRSKAPNSYGWSITIVHLLPTTHSSKESNGAGFETAYVFVKDRAVLNSILKYTELQIATYIIDDLEEVNGSKFIDKLLENTESIREYPCDVSFEAYTSSSVYDIVNHWYFYSNYYKRFYEAYISASETDTPITLINRYYTLTNTLCRVISKNLKKSVERALCDKYEVIPTQAPNTGRVNFSAKGNLNKLGIKSNTINLSALPKAEDKVHIKNIIQPLEDSHSLIEFDYKASQMYLLGMLCNSEFPSYSEFENKVEPLTYLFGDYSLHGISKLKSDKAKDFVRAARNFSIQLYKELEQNGYVLSKIFRRPIFKYGKNQIGNFFRCSEHNTDFPPTIDNCGKLLAFYLQSYEYERNLSIISTPSNSTIPSSSYKLLHMIHDSFLYSVADENIKDFIENSVYVLTSNNVYPIKVKVGKEYSAMQEYVNAGD